MLISCIQPSFFSFLFLAKMQSNTGQSVHSVLLYFKAFNILQPPVTETRCNAAKSFQPTNSQGISNNSQGRKLVHSIQHQQHCAESYIHHHLSTCYIYTMHTMDVRVTKVSSGWDKCFHFRFRAPTREKPSILRGQPCMVAGWCRPMWSCWPGSIPYLSMNIHVWPLWWFGTIIRTFNN